ncbi:UNVERIFIED_CONTAM: hypothetical protein GTU68_020481 [Idotea baltica]|nr:hypothetical protein [Idotea baltica]
MKSISIRGARTHNLKNIDLDLPRDALVVITGLSGSGKSSLAFDTLYAEGQRRYVESLSAYARQFLSMMEKPDVDHIEGLSPAISIEQKSTSHNPRSTVGTITEIYDYLRLLFARAGEPRCPTHDQALAAQTVSQMVDAVLAMEQGERLMLLAPVVQDRKGEHKDILENLRAQGFVRARVNGKVIELDSPPELELRKKHTIEAVVDRFKVRADLQQRLAESFETALNMADGIALVASLDDNSRDILFSSQFSCPTCGYSIPELEPRMFSFNNPAGACGTCDGLGIKQFVDPERIVANPELSMSAGAVRGWDRRNAYYFQLMKSLADHYDFDLDVPFENLSDAIKKVVLYGSGRTKIDFNYLSDRGRSVKRNHSFEGVIPNMQRRYHETESNSVREELAKYHTVRACPDCNGARLNEAARHVFIGDTNLSTVTDMPVGEVTEFFKALNLPDVLDMTIEEANRFFENIPVVAKKLDTLIDVGLTYIKLGQNATTLSGGEAQRVKLAKELSKRDTGKTLYILDEPTTGLHFFDIEQLLKVLHRLRDHGNTIIVIEHNLDVIKTADWLIDMGPEGGSGGGLIVATGTPEQVADNASSHTGHYLKPLLQ